MSASKRANSQTVNFRECGFNSTYSEAHIYACVATAFRRAALKARETARPVAIQWSVTSRRMKKELGEDFGLIAPDAQPTELAKDALAACLVLGGFTQQAALAVVCAVSKEALTQIGRFLAADVSGNGRREYDIRIREFHTDDSLLKLIPKQIASALRNGQRDALNKLCPPG